MKRSKRFRQFQTAFATPKILSFAPATARIDCSFAFGIRNHEGPETGLPELTLESVG
jgi:hypothetical protein